MSTISTLRQSDTRSSSRHVYELRIYHVNEGKMDALKTRFADHVDALFRRHNMKSLGYWQPEDPPNSHNMLVYILEHPSRQEAENNWAEFRADTEWKKVPIGASTMLSSKIVKGAKLKVYPGAPRGMCTTMKDQVNEDHLTFIKN